MIADDGEAGQKFGHCAETHALVPKFLSVPSSRWDDVSIHGDGLWDKPDLETARD